MALTLTTDERTELERRVRSLKIRAEDARRARVILMLADGDSYSTIEATVPCYRDYINRWRRRFLAARLDGMCPERHTVGHQPAIPRHLHEPWSAALLHDEEADDQRAMIEEIEDDVVGGVGQAIERVFRREFPIDLCRVERDRGPRADR
jgi:hypothetical protein